MISFANTSLLEHWQNLHPLTDAVMWLILLMFVPLLIIQGSGSSWLRPVWDSGQRGVAVTRGWCGSGTEDAEPRSGGGGQGQVPAGGSHHGTVQSPKRGEVVWSDHCGRACELLEEFDHDLTWHYMTSHEESQALHYTTLHYIIYDIIICNVSCENEKSQGIAYCQVHDFSSSDPFAQHSKSRLPGYWTVSRGH